MRGSTFALRRSTLDFCLGGQRSSREAKGIARLSVRLIMRCGHLVSFYDHPITFYDHLTMLCGHLVSLCAHLTAFYDYLIALVHFSARADPGFSWQGAFSLVFCPSNNALRPSSIVLRPSNNVLRPFNNALRPSSIALRPYHCVL